jgi:hypothetical protein
MPQVGFILFFDLLHHEAKQNYRFPATGLPVEVKRTVRTLSTLTNKEIMPDCISGSDYVKITEI